MTIIYWSVGWLAGLWLADMLPAPAPWALLIGGLAMLATWLWRGETAVRLLLVAISATGFAGATYRLTRSNLNAPHIAAYHDQGEVIVTGYVARPPLIRDTSQQLTVTTDSLQRGPAPAQSVHGDFLIHAPRFPVLEYGTRLRLTGELVEPENNSEFDYTAYLARQGIFTEMEYPRLDLLEGRAGNPLLWALTAVRREAQQAIAQMLPNPQAALLSGILLGDDQGLPRDLQDDFQATGMTHIIAISGFNIAIIAGLLLQGGRHLAGRRAAAWIALGGLVLYTLLVGAEASVVRAAIMGALLIVATQFLGRPTFAPAGLAGAAFFMTAADPDLLWHIGFQLSAAATLGLMMLVGPGSAWLERHLPKPGATRFLSDILLTSLAAFVFTLPVLLYHFGAVSLVNLPANLFILPVQSWLMLWGGVATLLGMVHPLLGQLPAWIDWLFLTYTIKAVRFFADLPVAVLPLKLPRTAVPLLAATLAGVAWIVRDARPSREQLVRGLGTRRARLLALGLTACVLLLAAAALWRAPDGRLHVTFLDVGQGDAILIQAPGGRQMLVDGGAYPNVLLSRLGDHLPFWDKRLDVVLATHPDNDHVAGLVEVLSHYQVDQLIGSTRETSGSASYDALLQAGTAYDVSLHIATPGERIVLDQDVALEVLHAATSAQLSDNDNSVVLLLHYRELTVLLTGDSAAAAETRLLAGGRPLQATVLKAGHHGARSSSGLPFLQAVQPDYVIISAGADNHYGHPHAETLERITACGATALRTDELGTIELISDGTRLWWHVEKGRPAGAPVLPPPG